MQWRKSSYGGGADDQHCVELGRSAAEFGLAVRDSKDPDAGHLTLTVPVEWRQGTAFNRDCSA
ncbi:DUF397 domain-containing protein [Actinomadura sp. NPDC049753]|uniref:DUF397 domain-containing protein n=1 Tax=Actinomadura sp. NPDC049753 TaxID=3154739 RepID=UPI003417D359